ncbi:protein NnrT [Roseobacter sp. YSTF-M11]|uniref:Protein NnrT n=1 Tax=Roseobacter insulae TaxID=2859783 RepID=A0A9X1K0E4_9RHOB|nr:protein NnrT [Roseobacter insulae]MBW4710476.1 protein NnrT [Roseobacter insulae]
MRFLIPLLVALAASPAIANAYDRPIPQAQSATAEFWYALASLTLLFSMIAVHWLVSRR